MPTVWDKPQKNSVCVQGKSEEGGSRALIFFFSILKLAAFLI